MDMKPVMDTNSPQVHWDARAMANAVANIVAERDGGVAANYIFGFEVLYDILSGVLQQYSSSIFCQLEQDQFLILGDVSGIDQGHVAVSIAANLTDDDVEMARTVKVSMDHAAAEKAIDDKVAVQLEANAAPWRAFTSASVAANAAKLVAGAPARAAKSDVAAGAGAAKSDVAGAKPRVAKPVAVARPAKPFVPKRAARKRRKRVFELEPEVEVETTVVEIEDEDETEQLERTAAAFAKLLRMENALIKKLEALKAKAKADAEKRATEKALARAEKKRRKLQSAYDRALAAERKIEQSRALEEAVRAHNEAEAQLIRERQQRVEAAAAARAESAARNSRARAMAIMEALRRKEKLGNLRRLLRERLAEGNQNCVVTYLLTISLFSRPKARGGCRAVVDSAPRRRRAPPRRLGRSPH